MDEILEGIRIMGDRDGRHGLEFFELAEEQVPGAHATYREAYEAAAAITNTIHTLSVTIGYDETVENGPGEVRTERITGTFRELVDIIYRRSLLGVQTEDAAAAVLHDALRTGSAGQHDEIQLVTE